MIFEKAIRRDLANLAGVVFATLFTIMVTTTLIRMLGRAAGGKVDTASLLPLIAFAAINLLPILLVLTVYIAVLMSLTRAYRDSEMVIWFASGRSLGAWVRPVLRFALPVLLLVGAVAFEAAPWANRQTTEYTRRFEQREDVSQVAAGQFRESSSAERVFFVESLSEDQSEVRNVFVTQTTGERLTILVAAAGRVESEADGDRFLVLEKGRRYDGERSVPAFRLMEFERYGLRLEPRVSSVRDESSKAKSTVELLASPAARDRAELVWRIGLPVSLIVLALLAIPLSSLNPRVGRSVNLVVALLVFVVYSNLISLSQAWVAQERIGFTAGVLSVHAAFLAVVALLFWRRLSMSKLRLAPALAQGVPRMTTIGRYLAREITSSVLFVLVGFLALFAFFDLVNELDDIGRGGYKLQHALGYVALGLPSRVYEVMPIAALIGTIFALSQFAAHSEFTAMRAAGLGRGRAIATIVSVGFWFAIGTAFVGEVLTPQAEKLAQKVRLSAMGDAIGGQFRSGLWIRDTLKDAAGRVERMRFVNIRDLMPDTTLRTVRIFEFDRDFRLLDILDADSGRFVPPGSWRLERTRLTTFEPVTVADNAVALRATRSVLPEFMWPSELTPDLLGVLMLVPERMSAWTLAQYVRHLRDNQQRADRYEIALWKKVVYPIAVIVMMVLALPFAYLQVRAGGTGYKVFAGIMLGVAFHFLNSLFAHLGLLNTWPAWLAASIPSMFAALLALGMLAWVDRAR